MLNDNDIVTVLVTVVLADGPKKSKNSAPPIRLTFIMVFQVGHLSAMWSFHRLKPGTLPSLTQSFLRCSVHCHSVPQWGARIEPMAQVTSMHIQRRKIDPGPAIDPGRAATPCHTPYPGGSMIGCTVLALPPPSTHSLFNGSASSASPLSQPCRLHPTAHLTKNQFSPYLPALITSYLYIARNVCHPFHDLISP